MRVLIFIAVQISTIAGNLNLICDIQTEFEWNTVDKIKSTCKATDLIVSDPVQNVVSFNGAQTIMENIHGLWVEHAQCKYIPRMIDSYLPHVQAIAFKNTDLENISKFDLAPFTELVTLVLIENKIKFLDGDLFEYNADIKSLILNEPSIAIVNGDLLMTLKSLNLIEFHLKLLKDTCTGICSGKRCMKDTIEKFRENCEFDFIYPKFKAAANEIKKISENCNQIS